MNIGVLGRKGGVNYNELKGKGDRKQSLMDNDSLSSARSSASDKNVTLNVRDLDERFFQFCKNSENMSSFLNTRATKKRFEDFHLKMKIWKDRVKLRKRLMERYKKKSALIMT